MSALYRWLFLACGLLLVTGCKISVSTTGASISPNTTTCRVSYFPNRARIINASLSSELTDALRDKIQSQTSLKLVNGEADVVFEGEITGYDTQPVAITGQNVAAMDRLTITVNVNFTNQKNPEYNFSNSFSRYADYSRSSSLQSVEAALVSEILLLLLEDIYNQAFVNW